VNQGWKTGSFGNRGELASMTASSQHPIQLISFLLSDKRFSSHHAINRPFFVLRTVAVLGVLVLIRTFLNWSLADKIESRWPWQTQRGHDGGVHAIG